MRRRRSFSLWGFFILICLWGFVFVSIVRYKGERELLENITNVQQNADSSSNQDSLRTGSSILVAQHWISFLPSLFLRLCWLWKMKMKVHTSSRWAANCGKTGKDHAYLFSSLLFVPNLSSYYMQYFLFTFASLLRTNPRYNPEKFPCPEFTGWASMKQLGADSPYAVPLHTYSSKVCVENGNCEYSNVCIKGNQVCSQLLLVYLLTSTRFL